MTTRYNDGVLELCAISMFMQEDRDVCAGYKLSDGSEVSADSIYPILRRLKQEECVSSYVEKVSGGFMRRNYVITDKGKLLLDKLSRDLLGGGRILSEY